MYKNIRTFKSAGHVKTDDGDERYVIPPPPPPKGSSWYGWQRPNSSIADGFSAACWMFGQELSDIAADRNETPPVLGLVQKHGIEAQSIGVFTKCDELAHEMAGR